MLIAARNGMIAGKRKPTAKDYIQDGLVAMWDGIENAGWGVHDPNATIWVDLSGNSHTVTLNDLVFDNNSLVGVRSTSAYGTITGTLPAIETIEAVFKVTRSAYSIEDYGWCVIRLTSKGICGSHYITPQRSMFNFGGYANRPGFTSYSTDTNSVVLVGDPSGVYSWYKNGDAKENETIYGYTSGFYYNIVGCNLVGNIYAIRLYSRALTADEIAANYAVDKARFNLP